MALTIEDGTIVIGANSFVTIAELNAYTSARGVTLYQEDGTTELTDAQKEAILIDSYDYLNSQEPKIVGERVSKDQTGIFPRYNVEINGFCYDSNEIPSVVKTIQILFAIDVNAGVDVYSDNSASIKKKDEAIDGAVSRSIEYQTGSVINLRESLVLFKQICGYQRFTIPIRH